VATEDDFTRGGILHLYRYVDDPMDQKMWTDLALLELPPGEGVSVFKIIDIDGDRDKDIIAANHQGFVYLLENPHPEALERTWNVYRVAIGATDSATDLREIDSGDIDGDGDLDIVVADEGGHRVIWYENDGLTLYDGWKVHIVDSSEHYLRWCHDVKLGDIDGDGDLDIAVAAAASNVFVLYINELKKAK